MTLGNASKLCEPQLLLVDIPGGIVVKNLPANAGDTRDAGLIPGLGGSPGEGNGNLLQYSCLGESHGQRSLEGYSPGVRKSQTQLK